MQKIWVILFAMLAGLFGFLPLAKADQEQVIADFDSGQVPSNIGGDFGTWNYDPADETQGSLYSFEPDDYKQPLKGYCVRLDYDVDSPNPAFNGFWMKLKGIDVSGYNRLSFWVKGSPDGRFTSRFKVELKNRLGKRAVYLVENVTSEWKEILIDFKKTPAIEDWTELDELTVVFDDILATYKEGTIFIDQIVFKTLLEES